MARDAYRMMRDQGDRINAAGDLFTVARLLHAAGRPADAARVLSRSLAQYEELGASVASYDRGEIDTLVAHLNESLTHDAFVQATEAGRSLTDGDIDAIIDDAVSALT